MLKIFKSKIKIFVVLVSSVLIYLGLKAGQMPKNHRSNIYQANIVSKEDLKSRINSETIFRNIATIPAPQKMEPENTSLIHSTQFHIINNKKRIYNEEEMDEISKSANLEDIEYKQNQN